MRVSSFVAALAVLFGVASFAEAQCNLPTASGVQQHQLKSGGLERSYRLFVPPKYDGHTPLPVVLELHGSGGTSAGQARTSGFEDVAAREGFVVASLQADGGRWNVPVSENRPDDVAYVGNVIDDMAAQLCIDKTRVYATGFSG